MSAKHGKKSAHRSASTPPPSAPVAATAGGGAAAAVASSSDAPASSTAWLDSNDPRRRMIGKVVLVGVWIYVAALWLLALDQTFNWGIFGPKLPPMP